MKTNDVSFLLSRIAYETTATGFVLGLLLDSKPTSAEAAEKILVDFLNQLAPGKTGDLTDVEVGQVAHSLARGIAAYRSVKAG